MSLVLQTIVEFLRKMKANPPDTQPQQNNEPRRSGSSAAEEFLAIDSFENIDTLTINGAINNLGDMDGNCNGTIISSSKSTKMEEEVIKNLKSEARKFFSGSSNGRTLNLTGAINNVGRTTGGCGNGSIIIYDGASIDPNK